MLTVENPPIKTKITVNKIWNDANNKDGIRPGNLTYTLTGKAGSETTYEDTQTVEVAKDGSASYTWDNLVTYKDGVKINYEVTEAEVEGYETVVGDLTAEEVDGMTCYTVDVVNTHVIPPEKDVFEEGKLNISINNQEVKPGQKITYGITYANTTGEKVTATITDKLPELTTFVEATDGGTNSDGTVTWTLEVENNEVKTVYVTVQVSNDVSGDILKNTAQVKEGEHDPVDTNETENPTPYKLVISKDLKDYVNNGEIVPAAFAFEITGKYTDKDGKSHDYRNTIGMEFTAESDAKQIVEVTGIPSTIEGLTVKEIYAGNYTPGGNDTVSATIKQDGEHKGKYYVEFTNTMKNHEYKGGLVNNYAKNEKGEYKYQGDTASPETNE